MTLSDNGFCPMHYNNRCIWCYPEEEIKYTIQRLRERLAEADDLDKEEGVFDLLREEFGDRLFLNKDDEEVVRT